MAKPNKKLRKARIAAGLNLYELADKTGYSFETVRKVEVGRPSSLEVKEKIAEVLDLPFYNYFPEEIEKLSKYKEEIDRAIEAGAIKIDEDGEIVQSKGR